MNAHESYKIMTSEGTHINSLRPHGVKQ